MRQKPALSCVHFSIHLPIGFCPRIWHWKVTWFPCTALVTEGGCRTKYKLSFFASVDDDNFVIESTISFCFFLTFVLSIVPPDTNPVKLFFLCGRTENSVYSRSFCCPPSKLGNSPGSWNSQSLLITNKQKWKIFIIKKYEHYGRNS